jgi:hypothetical protein
VYKILLLRPLINNLNRISNQVRLSKIEHQLLTLTSDLKLQPNSNKGQLAILLQIKETKMMSNFREESKIEKEDKTLTIMVTYSVIKIFQIYNFFKF